MFEDKKKFLSFINCTLYQVPKHMSYVALVKVGHMGIKGGSPLVNHLVN